jgi:ankyrin repeat protein
MRPRQFLVLIWYVLLAQSAFASELDQQLYEAVGAGSLERVKHLIEAGANVNAQHAPYDQAPIHIAPAQGLDMVRLLVDNGAEVDLMDADHSTALFGAVLFGIKAILAHLAGKARPVHAARLPPGRAPPALAFS